MFDGVPSPGLLLLENRHDVPVMLRLVVQFIHQFVGLVPVEQSVVELVAEGLEAGVAGRLAALDASGQKLPGRGDQFLPAGEHLLQQPGAARHRVVDQQVQLVVGLLDQQQLQVFLAHVEQAGRRRPQALPDVDAVASFSTA